MKVFFTNTFKRATKKLHSNQLNALEDAIDYIQNHPKSGELKVGDLAGVRVYKFPMLHQLVLLAYIYDGKKAVTLLWFAPHENFYRDFKNQIRV